jgi:hypothetical protein
MFMENEFVVDIYHDAAASAVHSLLSSAHMAHRFVSILFEVRGEVFFCSSKENDSFCSLLFFEG